MKKYLLLLCISCTPVYDNRTPAQQCVASCNSYLNYYGNVLNFRECMKACYPLTNPDAGTP